MYRSASSGGGIGSAGVGTGVGCCVGAAVGCCAGAAVGVGGLVGAGVGCTRSVPVGSRGSVSCICGIAAADSSISTARLSRLLRSRRSFFRYSLRLRVSSGAAGRYSGCAGCISHPGSAYSHPGSAYSCSVSVENS